MVKKYAVGKHAFGFCDICGFRYPLKELRPEVVNLVQTNIKVCRECWSPDQPQNRLGSVDYSDPQALRDPRPTGGESGRNSNDIIQTFDSSTLLGTGGWVVVGGSAGGSATSSIDAENNWLKVVYTNTHDPQFWTLNFYQPFSSADYKIIRVRWKIEETTQVVKKGLTQGVHQFFWSDDEQSNFSESRKLSIPMDYSLLNQMGDQFFEVEFDMTGNAEWVGTIDKIRFDFSNAVSTVKADYDLYVEWIKIQTVPRTEL